MSTNLYMPLICRHFETHGYYLATNRSNIVRDMVRTLIFILINYINWALGLYSDTVKRKYGLGGGTNTEYQNSTRIVLNIIIATPSDHFIFFTITSYTYFNTGSVYYCIQCTPSFTTRFARSLVLARILNLNNINLLYFFVHSLTWPHNCMGSNTYSVAWRGY